MPLLSRKRTILLKTETTYGTDAVPVAASDALLVRNLDIVPISATTVSRDLIRPYMGNSPQLLADTSVEVSFEVELAGSGTAGTAPRWGPAMLACGTAATTVASTSVTYAPVSSAFSSCSIYFFADGVRHIVTGWRGTFTINGQVGQIPTIQFQGTGIYNAPTDNAVGAVTYANQADPLVFRDGNTSGFSLFSYSGCLMSVNFAIANELVFRQMVGCTKESLITDRKPAGTVVMDAVTIATKDYFTIANGNTTGSLTFTHGTTAGNRVVFTSAQTDIANPSYTDDNGVIMLSVPFVSVPTTAGNDEFSIALT